jgi:hypothetical protein
VDIFLSLCSYEINRSDEKTEADEGTNNGLSTQPDLFRYSIRVMQLLEDFESNNWFLYEKPGKIENLCY